MEDLLSNTILGLSTAAVFALAASGLVLTYTTTGIFNFAHGAIGMLGAFAYWQLLEWGVPTGLAVAIVLLAVAPAEAAPPPAPAPPRFDSAAGETFQTARPRRRFSLFG